MTRTNSNGKLPMMPLIIRIVSKDPHPFALTCSFNLQLNFTPANERQCIDIRIFLDCYSFIPVLNVWVLEAFQSLSSKKGTRES